MKSSKTKTTTTSKKKQSQAKFKKTTQGNSVNSRAKTARKLSRGQGG
jgi:hypothetical protein